MGEIYQYHITMLVNREQEDAIKDLFTDRHWKCWMNVISEQTVEDVKQGGYDYIFTNVNDDNDEATEQPEFVEIKSEVVNVDYEMDTDSDDAASDVTIETPIDTADNVEEIKSGIFPEDDDTAEISNYANPNNEVIKTSGSMESNIELPSSSEDANISHLKPDATEIPSKPSMSPMASEITPVNLHIPGIPTTVLPASGYMSDLVSQNIQNTSTVPVMNRTRRNNVRYTSNITKEVPKSGYIEDGETEINSSTQEKLKEKVVKGGKRVGNVKEGDSKLTDSKKKEKPKSKKYSHQQVLSYCQDCHEKFISLEKLWKHRNEVQHTLPVAKPKGFAKRHYSPEELLKMGFLQCPECDYYFQDRRKLRQHLFACHREIMPNPVCQICGEEFESYKDLHKHKREKQHMDSIWRLNSYQCETCGKHISKYENFKRHKELSCGKSEAELEVLRIHPCEICGKLFTTMKSARQHVAVVHKQEEAVCDVCGKVCKTKFALRSHKRRHFETNRKHVCEECGKGFFSVAILKQHNRVHTKEKPFKCPLCEYTSSLAGNINKHSQNVHKQKVTPIDLRELGKSAS